MAYIFLDESGDLGFDFTKKKTSKKFVITCLFTKNKRPIEKIIQNIFSGFTRKEIKNHHGVLHCYKEKPTTRQKVLNSLNEKDIYVMYIYLNKNKVYARLKDQKQFLYNYVANILLDRICTKKLIPTNDSVELIASKRETNKFLNDNFCSYLLKQTKNNHEFTIKIFIKEPCQEKGLQAVDCVCWAVFRKIEHDDESYVNLIKQKIVEANPLFP